MAPARGPNFLPMDLPDSQASCVAQAIYSEARGESELGKRAVGHVILNRVRSGRFPSTPCGVVRQPGQFTYRIGTGPMWRLSQRVVGSLGPDPTNGALYFRAKHARVSWGRRLVATIGNHLFFR